MHSSVTKEKLQKLMELAAVINSSLNPRIIKTRAIEAATTLTNAETGSLLLIDQEEQELYFEVALGATGDCLKEVRVGLDQGIAGWVARTGEPLISHDPQNDPRFFRDADAKSHFVTRNLIAVPLRVKDKILGVLEAINRKQGAFGEPDLEILKSLANLVAPAVENAFLYQELRNTFFEMSFCLADALEKRDLYTGGHTQRVRDYSIAIGARMGLADEEMDTLMLSAILHDIGKIGVDDAILRKEAPLSQQEFSAMKQHSRIGADILQYVSSLEKIVPGVLSHHEKFDGGGYPNGLNGEEIPINARIIAVADTYDSMTSDRPYRKALSREAAVAELYRCSDSQFDRKIVDVFVEALEKGVV